MSIACSQSAMTLISWIGIGICRGRKPENVIIVMVIGWSGIQGWLMTKRWEPAFAKAGSHLSNPARVLI